MIGQVIVQSGAIGPNALLNEQGVTAMVIVTPAPTVAAGSAILNKVYTLYSLADAVALGITAAHDTANAVVAHYHIKEFYRMGGEGSKLYIILAPQTATVADLYAVYGQKLLNETKYDTRLFGICYNPAAGYTPTYADGMDNNVRALITQGVVFKEWAAANFGELHVIVEGRDIGGATTLNAATLLDVRNIPAGASTVNGENVSIVIGQDYNYASALASTICKKHACIGTALGVLAGVPVEINLGENETLNLTNEILTAFVVAGLSNNTTVESNKAALDTLDTKGYIFPISYTGLSGYRFNNDHCCVAEVVDYQNKINENRIAYSRVMNEGKRQLRKVLLPKLKTTHDVNPVNGRLPLGVVKHFEGLGNDVFANMQKNKHITVGVTEVDPQSDLLTGDKALNVKFYIVPRGTVGKINGLINLKTQIA